MTNLSRKAEDVALAIGNEKDDILAIGRAPKPPVLSFQGAELELPGDIDRVVALCEQAPFGRGVETVTDVNVRKVLQTDKITVQFDGLNDVISQVQAQICPWVKLTAHFYKLLVYRPGDFFACHRDSKKTNDHLATLVVDLGLPYRGGKIVFADKDPLQCNVDEDDDEGDDEGEVEKQSAISWTGGAPGAWACWFTSLWHEVLPLTDGTRVVATYNLMVDRSSLTPAVIHLKLDDSMSYPFIEQKTSSLSASSTPGSPTSPEKSSKKRARQATSIPPTQNAPQSNTGTLTTHSTVSDTPLPNQEAVVKLPIFSSSNAKTTVLLNSPLMLLISLFLSTPSTLVLLGVNKQIKQCFPSHLALHHSLSLLISEAERLRSTGRNKLGFPLRHTYSFSENKMVEPWQLKGRDRVMYDVLCSLRLQPAVYSATLIREVADDYGLVAVDLLKSVKIRDRDGRYGEREKMPEDQLWLHKVIKDYKPTKENRDKVIDVPEYARDMLGGLEKVRLDQLLQFRGVRPDTEYDGDISWDATYYPGVLWCATQEQMARCFSEVHDRDASAHGLWGNAASFAMLAYKTGVMIVELFPMPGVDLGLCTSALTEEGPPKTRYCLMDDELD